MMGVGELLGGEEGEWLVGEEEEWVVVVWLG